MIHRFWKDSLLTEKNNYFFSQLLAFIMWRWSWTVLLSNKACQTGCMFAANKQWHFYCHMLFFIEYTTGILASLSNRMSLNDSSFCSFESPYPTNELIWVLTLGLSHLTRNCLHAFNLQYISCTINKCSQWYIVSSVMYIFIEKRL